MMAMRLRGPEDLQAHPFIRNAKIIVHVVLAASDEQPFCRRRPWDGELFVLPRLACRATNPAQSYLEEETSRRVVAPQGDTYPRRQSPLGREVLGTDAKSVCCEKPRRHVGFGQAVGLLHV